MNLPRYVTFCNNEYTIDKTKITFNIDPKDKLLLENIIIGDIISPDVYPLIYDNKSNNEKINFRTIEFFEELSQNHDLYAMIEDKESLMIGIRDLFVASMRNLLTVYEINLLKNVINLIDNNDVLIVSINGLDYSPYPTANKIIVKYIDNLNVDNDELKQHFIKNETGLYMVFIDPCELSYHNFENIISVDNTLKKELLILSTKSKKNYDKFTTFILDDKFNTLLNLDKLNLYVKPLNNLSRGGLRFIFKSDILADCLTTKLRKCVTDKNFVKVNNVFRYNKFSPNDKKFISHFDTPYYDATNSHCSKFTLIIYLTQGSNSEGVLTIDGTKITNINKNMCFLFDQKYEHEGSTYESGDKIFIRTELIFYDNNMKYNSRLAKLFNISCYMTYYSIYNDEIQKYTNDMFNYVAKNRYLRDNETKKILLLHKTYKNTHFITNGNDYYFTVNCGDIRDYAKIILLDYFNGRTKLDDKRIKTRMAKQKLVSEELIFNYIKKCSSDTKKNSKLVHIIDHSEDSEKDSEKDSDEDSNEDSDEDNNNMCCDFHCRVNFDPKKCSDVIEMRDDINENIYEYSVFILNNKIHINIDDMQIVDDKIMFKTNGYFDKINFAACWNADNSPSDYIDVEDERLSGFFVPYIRFIKKESYGFHFSIDMFNNGFIIEENKMVPFASIE